MAIRWASDRVDKQGVIAFVTNGSWIDGNVDSGIRACLAEEFSSVHVLHLRGNARTSGERSRVPKVEMCLVAVHAPQSAITIFVKNPNATHDGCKIHYRDIGDYLTREQKLEALTEAVSIKGISDWQEITPNKQHDWVGPTQRSVCSVLSTRISGRKGLAGHGRCDIQTVFVEGYATGRDAYIYNFSRDACAENAQRMTQDYLAALSEMEAKILNLQQDTASRQHDSNLSWDANLKEHSETRRNNNRI